MAQAAVIALAAVAAGTSVYTTVQQGRQQNKWARYNARMAQQEATRSKLEAEARAKTKRAETRRILSRQRALYGARGVISSEGSPLLVMENTAAEGELDALLEEYGGLIRKQNLVRESEAEKLRGKQARNASYWGAGQTLLSTGALLASTSFGGTSGPTLEAGSSPSTGMSLLA